MRFFDYTTFYEDEEKHADLVELLQGRLSEAYSFFRYYPRPDRRYRYNPDTEIEQARREALPHGG